MLSHAKKMAMILFTTALTVVVSPANSQTTCDGSATCNPIPWLMVKDDCGCMTSDAGTPPFFTCSVTYMYDYRVSASDSSVY
jgi:hypothetical protein